MNVLISGGPSPLGVHLADYLLRKGHRVSIMQHQELDVSALVEDIARTVDLQDRLKTSNYGNRLSELHGTTCSLKTTTTQSVDITNVSHVVFDGTHLCGITRAIVVRRSLGCLVELLEATKGGNTRPHFTLLVNAGVTGKADFTSVLESSMEIVVSLYQSLYGVPVTLVKLLYSTDNRIWTASGEASVVVGELPPAIIETMLTGPTCKHIYIAKSSSSGLHLSWSQLWNTWNDPSAGTLSPPTNSKWEDVVFTTFLTSKKDPQRNIFVKKDNYSYMADWHLSLHNVGIKAVVFHDGLGDQFRCGLYTCCITFIVDLSNPNEVGFIGDNYNDVKWACQRDVAHRGNPISTTLAILTTIHWPIINRCFSASYIEEQIKIQTLIFCKY